MAACRRRLRKARPGKVRPPILIAALAVQAAPTCAAVRPVYGRRRCRHSIASDVSHLLSACVKTADSANVDCHVMFLLDVRCRRSVDLPLTLAGMPPVSRLDDPSALPAFLTSIAAPASLSDALKQVVS